MIKTWKISIIFVVLIFGQSCTDMDNIEQTELEFSTIESESALVNDFINNSSICSSSNLRQGLSNGFKSNCISCHGNNGEGVGIFPKIEVGSNFEDYKNLIRFGKGSMPSFNSGLISDLSLKNDYEFFFQSRYCNDDGNGQVDSGETPSENENPGTNQNQSILSINILGTSGMRVLNNPITLQGNCLVGPVIVINVNEINMAVSCLGVEGEVGTYSQSIELPEYGDFSVSVQQQQQNNFVDEVLYNLTYTAIDNACSSSNEFRSFKQAMESGQCYDCHGDDNSQLYGNFRVFDACEEDWISSQLNGERLVLEGRALQSKIYYKMHGSGVTISSLRMPPFRSNSRTQSEFNNVVAELSSSDSSIRMSIRAWIESLDDASIESLSAIESNSLIITNAVLDEKPTQFVKFDLIDSNGQTLESLNASSSPYQAVFVPTKNDTYTIRASAIEFNYDPQVPNVGISSVLEQSITINSIMGDDYNPGGNGSGQAGADLESGLIADYYSSTNRDLQSRLNVNSQQIVPNIDFGFSGNNSGVHPEFPEIVDNFSIVYSGFINVPITGDYTFIVQVDDNIHLTIGDQTLFNHQAGGNNTLTSMPISLNQGQLYPILLEFEEQVFDGQVRLSWVGPGIAQEIVPAESFLHSETLRNAEIKILAPVADSQFQYRVPSITGNCIGGEQVILSGGVTLPSTQICDLQSNTFNFMDVELSNSDGEKELMIRQVISGVTLSDSLNVFKDTTPPSLTLNGSPVANEVVYNGTIITGDCEAGYMVNLTGSVTPQSVPCNNKYSFIVEFIPNQQNLVEVQVNQTDGLGNSITLSRNYGFSIERDLASADVVVQDFANTCTNLDANSASIQESSILTKVQYINTLEDLFNYSFQNILFEEISSSLQIVPDRQPEATLTSVIRYKRTITDYNEQAVVAFERVADRISSFILDDDSRATIFLGNCFGNPNNTCVQGFINDFGKKVYRRPLRAEEANLYLTLFNEENNPREGFKILVYTMLQSPFFLYRLENEGLENGNFTELTDYEVISRISYSYLDTMPDEYLMGQADADGNLSQSQVNTIIDTIFDEPRYRQRLLDTLWHFYSEWLEVEYGQSLAISPKTNLLAGTLYNNLDQGREVRNAMVDEVRALVEFQFNNGGSFSDLMTSNRSFASNSNLASFYGVERFMGESLAEHSIAQRYGVLTTPGYLASSLDYVNSFKRGAHLHKYVFCGDFGSATNANPDPPEFDKDLIQTNRQFFTSLVPEGSSCMDCHDSINNMGFVFEEYNFLGQFKTNRIEPIINSSGEVISELNVHPVTSPIIGNSRYSVDGAKDLIGKGLDSQVAQACFSKQYFRYFYGKLEQSEDSCSINNLFNRTLNSPIRDVFKEIGKSPSIMRKRFQ